MLRMLARLPRSHPLLESLVPQCGCGAPRLRLQLTHAAKGGKGQGNEANSKGLTPYQGRRRTFGFYRCPQCRHIWESCNSWANMGQQCQLCKTNVYPYHQKPLFKVTSDEDHIDETKPHLQDLCEKCQKLGRCCKEHEP